MPDDSSTPRRDFLRLSVGSTIAMAAGLEGCATMGASTAGATPAPQSSRWDLSWADRLKAPYKVVFNVTQKSELPLMQVAMWMDGYRQAYGAQDSDVNAVLVFRHEAVTMLLGDDIWARLAIVPASGNAASQTQPTGKNPWMGGDTPGEGSRSGVPTIRDLLRRGVTMVGCGIALGGQTRRLKDKEGLTDAVADEAIRAALAPGAFIAPNGIFAVGRAQDAGCAYFVPG